MEENKSIHALAYFNLLKTGSWIEDVVKNSLKPYSLTHAQLNALYILSENDPEPVSVNELKKRILVSNPDVTRLLDRLVRKEYVRRRTCPENRRKIDITLTDGGRAIFILAHQSVKRALGDFFEQKITAEEAQELRRILHQIRK
ncbi:MAG: MarR family transcriptional regulator [Bacteroidales bacterium]|nr:MarR family transcriptional regulator [Bacteroidales bacterium]